MKKRPSPKPELSKEELEFAAESEYARSIFRQALGDNQGCVDALRSSYELNPRYPHTILALGSVEYQLGRKAEGQELFRSLLSLPDNTPELEVFLDEAGSYLIQTKEYEQGLLLCQAATEKFPSVAALHQGLGCCAGHLGLHEDAIAASRRALELNPDSQAFVNDLGWSLFEADQLDEAETTLARAVAMDPACELARENLRRCQAESARRRKPARAPKRTVAKNRSPGARQR